MSPAPRTYINQLFGYGYVVCGTRLLMCIANQVGASSSKSHKDVDTSGVLVNEATDGAKEHQNVVPVDNAI